MQKTVKLKDDYFLTRLKDGKWNIDVKLSGKEFTDMIFTLIKHKQFQDHMTVAFCYAMASGDISKELVQSVIDLEDEAFERVNEILDQNEDETVSPDQEVQ